MTEYTLLAIKICIICAVTVLLRAIPFLIFRGSKKPPEAVTYLGNVLPPAIIAMLVVYCLRNTAFTAAGGYGIPVILGVTVTALLQLSFKKTLLSVVSGTAVYMILIRLMQVI